MHFDAWCADGYRVPYGRADDGTLYPLPLDDNEPTQGVTSGFVNLDWNTGGCFPKDGRPNCP